MKKILLTIIALGILVGGGYYLIYKDHQDLPLVNDVNEAQELTSLKGLVIKVMTPQDGDTIPVPLVVTGEAPGFWFFEASAPITLTNWDGLIIAEGYVTAQGEWMTEDYVPFSGTLEYVSPYKEGDPDFMKRGTLILQRDNPSGMFENDDAVELTVYFE